MKKKRINKKKFRLVIDTLTEIGKTRKRTWKVTNPEPYTYIFEKYDKRLCREVSSCFDCGRLYDGAKKIIEGNDDIFIGFIHSVIYDIYPELWGVLFNLRKRDVYLCFSQVRKGLTNSYKF